MHTSLNIPNDRQAKLKLALALSIKHQRSLENNAVIGLVSPENGLEKTVQKIGNEWQEVHGKLSTFQVPIIFERLITTPKQFKIVLGGRGSAKSETFGALFTAQMKDEKYKIGCFRELQNSIDDSVHALLSDKIVDIGYNSFDVTNSAIREKDGGEAKFKGLSRNPDAVKSMHGFRRFWIEEAQSTSAKSLKKLLPTLRGDDVELWVSMNPESAADPVYQRFVKPFERELLRDGYYEDDMHIVVRVNYWDNPWFPDNLEAQRLHDKDHLSSAEYEHVWEGKTLDTVERAIITTEMFDAAIDAHTKLGFKAEGIKVVAHDPSDEGKDPKGMAVRIGSVFTKIADMDYGKVEEGCTWSLNEAIDGNADAFVWDGDGMGLPLRTQIANALNGKRIDFSMFRGSEGAKNPNQVYQGEHLGKDKQRTNKQAFKNRRSQAAWTLRDRFYNTWRAVCFNEYHDPDTMISISSDGVENIDQLRAEVCRIPLKPNPNGYIQVMSKDQMWAEYEIVSPNMFDSMMMCTDYVPEIIKNKPIHIPAAPTYG